VVSPGQLSARAFYLQQVDLIIGLGIRAPKTAWVPSKTLRGTSISEKFGYPGATPSF